MKNNGINVAKGGSVAKGGNLACLRDSTYIFVPESCRKACNVAKGGNVAKDGSMAKNQQEQGKIDG